MQKGEYGIQPIKVSEVAETLIYKTLWDRVPKKSVITGLWLRNYWNTPLFNNCFLHILPVDKYKGFKYYFGCIVMVSPGERGLWMQGTAEDRIHYALDIEEKTKGASTANWAGVKDLEKELLALYEKNFPSTHGMLVGYNYSLGEIRDIVSKLNKEFWDSF